VISLLFIDWAINKLLRAYVDDIALRRCHRPLHTGSASSRKWNLGNPGTARTNSFSQSDCSWRHGRCRQCRAEMGQYYNFNFDTISMRYWPNIAISIFH